MPNLGRSWGESSLQPFGCKPVRLQLGQIQGASMAIHLHLLHGHRPRSRPDQIQNPKSKIQNPGPFGFWILDFGFWILDQFSLRSFCGGPKRPRLDFGFWISDFGLGVGSVGTVWILHKIFPSHADPGRRLYTYTQTFFLFFKARVCGHDAYTCLDIMHGFLATDELLESRLALHFCRKSLLQRKQKPTLKKSRCSVYIQNIQNFPVF